MDQEDALIRFISTNAVELNYISIVKLLLNLKILSRNYLIKLYIDCWKYDNYFDILQLLESKINFTQNEFEYILPKILRSYSYSNFFGIDRLKYLFKLMDTFQLNTNDIIDKIIDKFGKPFLHYAIDKNDLEVIKFLVSKEVDFVTRNEFFRKAFLYAQDTVSSDLEENFMIKLLMVMVKFPCYTQCLMRVNVCLKYWDML